MKHYDILAVTGCPTGVAHTYMAQEALEKAAHKLGVSIKVETHGQSGVQNALSKEDIENAKGIIVAADKEVGINRFGGKKVLNVSVSQGIKNPDKLIQDVTNAPIYVVDGNETKQISNGSGIGHAIYVDLMNGVSHMLPLVVAGGVLIAVSFFWGINSADPNSPQFNSFAKLLNTVGGFSMNLMVPVLCAYIAMAISKEAGLTVGFVTGMIAFNNGTGFLGGIVGGFLAGYTVYFLQKIFKAIPKSLDGLKQIFLLPVLGVFTAGSIMWFISVPMKSINLGMMSFLKGMENSNPLLLGIIVGVMCASDFGGPINKAAYLTGTALLAQGNYYFMAGVSAACMTPPIATGFSVLLNKKAYSKNEINAGYVNFLLGSTHITEGAIPFAASNPLVNIPIFMVGSAVAAVLSYASGISVPAPHGGFIVLPMVNKPLLWVIYILLGALCSGVLLSIADGKKNIKKESDTKISNILNQKGIILDVKDLKDKDEVLSYLSKKATNLGYSTNAEQLYKDYLNREALSSTGLESGIAIPHAQNNTIKSSKIMILRLNNPVDWGTLDNKKVNLIISFLVPKNDQGNHVKILSQVSKRLLDKQFINDLNNAEDAGAIYKLFVNGEE